MAKPWFWLGLGLVLTACGVPLVVVAPGFEPLTLEGRAGGAVASGQCGSVHHRPNHRLQIREDMDYLKLEVREAQNVTLLVRGADGLLCATPIQNRPAQISGYWQAGVYEIFIGSLDPGQSPPYRLVVSGAKSLP
jgi:hypothetical protein